MKNRQRNIFLPLLMAVLLLPSCSSDEFEEVKEEGQTIGVKLAVGVEKMNQVMVTRAGLASDTEGLSVSLADTDGIPTKAAAFDEGAISNLLILQFENTDSPDYDKLIAKQSLSGSELYSVTNDAEGRKIYNITANLQEIDNCQLYIIANEDPSLADTFKVGDMTVKEYQQMEGSFTGEDEIMGGSRNIMVGRYTGSLLVPEMKIWLTHLMAKLTLTIRTIGIEYYLYGVQLQKVPLVFQYYNKDGNYPDTDNHSDSYIDYAMFSTESPITDQDVFTWYMPENRRGKNDNIKSQKDKFKGTDPGTKGPESYSTHIFLSGIYQKGKVFITFYPGDNITTDFNIRRNTHYNMVVEIRNLNADDKRVTIGQK